MSAPSWKGPRTSRPHAVPPARGAEEKAETASRGQRGLPRAAVAAAEAVAEAAPAALQDWLLALSFWRVPRSGGPASRTPSALVRPPPQLPV